MGRSQEAKVEELLNTLLVDEARRLWNRGGRDDLQQPLGRLWRELDNCGRECLLSALASPPDLDPEAARFDRAIRLAMLEDAGGPPLPDVERIDVKAYRDQIAIAQTSNRDVTAEDLLALDDKDLLQRLSADTTLACERAWDAAVRREPRRGLRLFHRLLAEPAMPARALLEVIWEVSVPEVEPDLAMEAMQVLQDLPMGSIEHRSDVAPALARFLSSIAQQDWCDRGTECQLLCLWDRVIGPVVAASQTRDSPQPDLSTILPIDELVQVLLLRINHARSTEDAERRTRLRGRLERLTSDQKTFNIALRWLGRSLAFVHNVEPDWTEDKILPAFDWRANTTQARAAWNAYLAGSAATPTALWAKLRTAFAESFDEEKLSSLSDYSRRKLAQLLVRSLAFNASEVALQESDARQMLRACDLDMLRSAAWFLWRIVKDEDQHDRRDALWSTRLDRIVRDLWPRELDKRDGEVWASLLRLGIELNEAFRDAIAAIRSLPMPLTIGNFGILDELEESAHPDQPDRADMVTWILDLPFDPPGKVSVVSAIRSRLSAHNR
jgi:hypothetical protein